MQIVENLTVKITQAGGEQWETEIPRPDVQDFVQQVREGGDDCQVFTPDGRDITRNFKTGEVCHE